MNRKPYPSDVSDDEWAFVAPYLTLMIDDAPQRVYSLREVFNGARWIARAGTAWHMMPHDLPPWQAICQQTRRWIANGVFQQIVHDLRALLRLADGCSEQPSAAIFDSRTLQSTPVSGHRASYDGAKRRKGSKVHLAVDTLGHFLALHVTTASEQDRSQVALLAEQVQQATGESAATAASNHGIRLEVVKLSEAKKGFVLLPRRWVVERSFAWLARFRRLARDYERLPEVLAGMHLLAFVILMLRRFIEIPQINAYYAQESLTHSIRRRPPLYGSCRKRRNGFR
jgi:transposase